MWWTSNREAIPQTGSAGLQRLWPRSTPAVSGSAVAPWPSPQVLATWAKIGVSALARRPRDDVEAELAVAKGGHDEPAPLGGRADQPARATGRRDGAACPNVHGSL